MIKIDTGDLRKVLAASIDGFGFEKYEYLMDAVQKIDVSQDREFQRVFDGYYKVRRNAVWRKKFYDLFEVVRKSNPLPSFDAVVAALYKATGNVEASFASKLLASVNKDLPIWDRRVGRSLNLKVKGTSQEEKLADVKRVYQEVRDTYDGFLNSEEGREFIAEFDRLIPEQYRGISAVKKLDFYLWAKDL